MQRLARKRLVLFLAALCLLLMIVRERAMAEFPMTPTWEESKVNVVGVEKKRPRTARKLAELLQAC